MLGANQRRGPKASMDNLKYGCSFIVFLVLVKVLLFRSPAPAPVTYLPLPKTIFFERDYAQAHDVLDRVLDDYVAEKFDAGVGSITYIYKAGENGGGQSDQIKGMISVFWIAVALRRPFYILHEGIAWSNLYAPNRVQWTRKNTEELFVNSVDRVITVQALAERPESVQVSHNLLTATTYKTVVEELAKRYDISADLQFKLPTPEMKWKFFFNKGFAALFKPGPSVAPTLAAFKTNHLTKPGQAGKPAGLYTLIGVHVRAPPKDMPDSEGRLASGDLYHFGGCSSSLVSNLPPSEVVKFVVFGDNVEAVALVKADLAKLGTVIDAAVAGPVIHTDRQKSAAGYQDGATRASIESWILSLADALVISPSGFGNSAAYIGAVAHPHVYRFNRCESHYIYDDDCTSRFEKMVC